MSKVLNNGKKNESPNVEDNVVVSLIENTKKPSAQSCLIWRNPNVTFNNHSTLLVKMGERAAFIQDGMLMNVFDHGRHTLNTKNFPFIKKLQSRSLGWNNKVYDVAVYFVDDNVSRPIDWETLPGSEILVRDPKWNVPCRLQANGTYKIHVKDPGKLIMTMIGEKKVDFASLESVRNWFSAGIMQNIREMITQFIVNSTVEVLNICAYLTQLATLIEPFVSFDLNKHGLELSEFKISNLGISENDEYRPMLEKNWAEATGQKQAIATLDKDWARQKAFEIQSLLAQNPGGGGVASIGAGIGMAAVAGNAFAQLSRQMFGGSDEAGATVVAPDGDAPGAPTDMSESVRTLKTMLDVGAITMEQYQAKIDEIMRRL